MHNFHRQLIVTIAAASFAIAAAEAPAGYYRSLDGLTGSELKDAVCRLVYNHTQVNYWSLPSYFMQTDIYPNGENLWYDMYSDFLSFPHYAPSFTGMNREHSFPKSWWGGGQDTPAYVDINHLYPSEAAANMAKSNWPLGIVYMPDKSFDNGVTKVGAPVTGTGGGAKKVFEPADQYKGDFARTYFYMVTCYQNLHWSSKYSWMLQQNTYPTLAKWAQSMLLDWSRNDKVSQKELLRNDAVFKIQNNRNPFIDLPSLAEYIWGDKVGEPFKVDNQSNPGEPFMIRPTQDMPFDFGQVAIGSSATQYLNFAGENLTGDLELTFQRSDQAPMFSASSYSIPAYYGNSVDGYDIAITYTPTSLGKHSVYLYLSDGGLNGSRQVVVSGECLPVPTLSTLTAKAATDVTASSYVANWDIPANEVIDGYIVTRSHLNNGNSTSEEIMSEENSLLIEDVTGPESYFVQSVRLGVRSNPSNVIFVEPLGVGQLFAANALGTINHPNGVQFVCPEAVYNVSIYNIAGCLVTTLPRVNNYDFVELPRGCYIIAAPGQRAPFRIIVGE